MNVDIVLSDIHADINALNTILEIVDNNYFKKKYGEYNRIINLGDVLERGTSPQDVLEKLTSLEKNYPLISVMGNHDEAFLYNRRVSGSSLESIDAHLSLDKSRLLFFKQNKDGTFGKQEFIDKKNSLVCVHGGPLDPRKIMPTNAGPESWLYQKTWQRLTDEEFEFFSYAGYHYKASSAFNEIKKSMKDFVILCGHQHAEDAFKQENSSITEIHSTTKTITEKIGNYVVEKKEFEIKNGNNYLIRVGLGGPEGYFGMNFGQIHFGIIQYNPKKISLFTVV